MPVPTDARQAPTKKADWDSANRDQTLLQNFPQLPFSSRLYRTRSHRAQMKNRTKPKLINKIGQPGQMGSLWRDMKTIGGPTATPIVNSQRKAAFTYFI